MQGDGEQKPPSVLVVEDDEDAREAMVALLQMKGYDAGRQAMAGRRWTTWTRRRRPI